MKRKEKFVISSPANICGIYHSKDFSINHMFKNESLDRNFFVIETTNFGNLDIDFNKKKAGGVKKIIVSYTRMIEKSILILFCVFFGKRFEFNGMLKSDKAYYLPNIPNDKIKYKWLTTNNNNERIDKYVDMNWTKIGPILELLNNPKIQIFLKAGEFYKKALININYDPEIAYIDLIRCIEILGESIATEKDEQNIFDTNSSLEKIYNKIKSDKKLAKFFIKYHGNTKKFCDTILSLLPIKSSFREKSESNRENFGFIYLKQNKDNIINILKRTYTIRNKYIHEGLNFESFILPEKNGLNELIHSEPGDNIDETIKIGENLSFGGLERITRSCLLNYLNKT